VVLHKLVIPVSGRTWLCRPERREQGNDAAASLQPDGAWVGNRNSLVQVLLSSKRRPMAERVRC
jgi:hypothetical protein